MNLPADTPAEVIAQIEALGHGSTGENPDHLPAPFTVRDLDIRPAALSDREKVRAQVIAQDLASACLTDHVNYAHPFCSVCRQHKHWARASLSRWMARNPGRSLPEVMAPPSAPEDEAPATATTHSASKVMSYGELRALPRPSMLVDDVLPQAAQAVLIGRDASFKSFVALDWSLSIVLGFDWAGRQVDAPGMQRVLFIAGEGGYAFPDRVDAWLAARDLSPDDGDVPEILDDGLAIRNGTVDLYKAGPEFGELVRFVGEFKPNLIVVDTLARSVGGANQDSASDMSLVTAKVAELRVAAGHFTTILTVAHTQKSDSDARGSTAIEDNADAVIHAKRDGDLVRLKVTKMKDGPDGHEVVLRASPHADSIALVPVDSRTEFRALTEDVSYRVINALYAVRDQDEPNQSEVVRLVSGDGSGKEASRRGIREALGDLVRAGRVVETKAARNTRTYHLHPDEYPSGVES
ncbi:MAG: AAA family ATPase [Sporichthyaceae bacterium]|nr:AAA family ATPase [Sporichthyaceae bacterium]